MFVIQERDVDALAEGFTLVTIGSDVAWAKQGES
jgi:hypothetical protein